ncbi:branched-chain amino acid ABC transporter permease [Nitratireductor soli]|uniref:branched-chain amino acid ABC transporter permease n=1 Tax=Nitratireductor soli TaxID=1670619 RepID=UPI00069FA8D1|nr:branched-chain amino acid ABC transporter permease [Nitratireductor soli]
MPKPDRFAITGLIMLVLLILAPIVVVQTGWHGGLPLFTRIVIYALAVVSLDLIIGYGALISFGHAMFFSLGGYMVAILAHHTNAGDLIFGWAGSNSAFILWPLALLACALLGLVIGYLALKTRGVQFIMITLAFAQMVYFLLVSLQYYGGDDGLMMDTRNTMAVVDLDNPWSLYYLALGILVIWVLFCRFIVNSRFGMVFQGLRQSERRAINLGVNPLPFRLTAFVISAVGTGMAGILWANYAQFVTPDMATWAKSGEFMAIVTLGGLGTLLGPIAGAAAFIGLEQILTIWTEHWMIVMGPVLVLIALFGQQGMLGRFLKGGRHD